MREVELVRVPKAVLEELEAVRRYTRAEVLDTLTLRYVATETEKPALVFWVDQHPQEYGRGYLTASGWKNEALWAVPCRGPS